MMVLPDNALAQLNVTAQKLILGQQLTIWVQDEVVQVILLLIFSR